MFDFHIYRQIVSWRLWNHHHLSPQCVKWLSSHEWIFIAYFLGHFRIFRSAFSSLRKVKGNAGVAEIYESAAFVSWVFHESLLGIASFARSSVSNLTIMQLGWYPSSRSERGAESFCRASFRHNICFGQRLGIARLKCGRQEKSSKQTNVTVVSRIVRWRRNPANCSWREMPENAYFKPLPDILYFVFKVLELPPSWKTLHISQK